MLWKGKWIILTCSQTLLWWLPTSILPLQLWISAQSCAISKSSPFSTIYSLLLWTHAFLFSLMVCNSLLYLIIWHSKCPRFGHGTTSSWLLRFCDMLPSLSEHIISVLIQTQNHQPSPSPFFLFCFDRALVPCSGESLIIEISICATCSLLQGALTYWPVHQS